MSTLKAVAKRFSHNKYRLTVFGVLAFASVFAVGLVRFRIDQTGSGRYGFMIWNLFLAWIPFLIAYITYTAKIQRRWLYLVLPLSAFLWLIFFPNAPYILTDFQHLSVPSEIPVWFDVLLLIWYAFIGLFLGMISLFLMQAVIRREFGGGYGWGFVIIVAGLTSIGVYMGRFLRWNSWDIFNNLEGMLQFTLYYLFNPTMRSLVFAGVFTPFLVFVYILLYAFGHLLLEGQDNTAR
ncbi:MAG: DUF1361 domain-containing protein [Anaerolineales bacterium]